MIAVHPPSGRCEGERRKKKENGSTRIGYEHIVSCDEISVEVHELNMNLLYLVMRLVLINLTQLTQGCLDGCRIQSED